MISANAGVNFNVIQQNVVPVPSPARSSAWCGLRTLGTRKKTLVPGLFAEFTSLGALSGLLAGLSTTTLAWLLAETIFKFDYQFDISVALTGILGGTLIVVIAGLPGTRSVLAHPPIKTLREGAA